MATTADNKYVVKELCPGDHQALLDLAEKYVTHVTSGPTLMCLFLLHYHMSGKNFIVMNNCLQKRLVGGAPDDPEIFGHTPAAFYDCTYDLKGCADDKFLLKEGEPIKAVHKRIWHLHMW